MAVGLFAKIIIVKLKFDVNQWLAQTSFADFDKGAHLISEYPYGETE